MNPSGSPILPTWYSPEQLSRRWGVSRETILRLVRKGDLPVKRYNKRVYRISAVDAAVVAAQK